MTLHPTPTAARHAVRLLAAGSLFAASFTASAALVGTDPAGANGGYGIGFSFDAEVNLVIAQQFNVGAANATVGGITVWMNQNNDDPPGQFTLQVMNAIGPGATAANVLLTLTADLPNTPDGGHLPVSFANLALDLLGGIEYYLVVSSAAGPGTGWGTTTDLLGGTPGTVGSSYVGIAFGGNIGDYTLLNADAPFDSRTQFRIDPAEPSTGVPEPATAALLAAAWLAALTGRRRRADPDLRAR